MKAAHRLAAKPPGALAEARRLLKGQTPEHARQRIAEESLVFAALMPSPEAKEAFAAFLEKRKPDFAKLKRTR